MIDPRTELLSTLWAALLICLALSCSLTGCNFLSKQSADTLMPLAADLGSHHYPVTTQDPTAQRYFDQGLIFAYGFNHAEAARSFQAAYRQDPDCAMCYWGEALVYGPNINTPMAPGLTTKAYQLAQTARVQAKRASTKEQQLIAALVKRYSSTPRASRELLDRAYADAMRDLAKKYPDDAVIASLLAEALMDLHPWNFWTKQGNAKPWTAEIIATLERALRIDAQNPLANHLYIHVMEASPFAEKAIPSAERLPGLVPGSGHLVHMPAHIYIRAGRYNDAIKANQAAVRVDQGYLSHRHTESIYTQAYVPHNHHFLWAAAIKTGRKALAIEAANAAARHVDQALLAEPGFTGTLQHFLTLPLLTHTLFGVWDAVIIEEAPADDLVYARGVYHYAQGLALLRQGHKDAARQQSALLDQAIVDVAKAHLTVFDLNQASTILQIAASVLRSELALERKDFRLATTYLQDAVKLEDGLNYTEPKDWYLPPRQILGAVLRSAAKPEKAEAVYRQDLAYHPQNGWSLFGLMMSLREQGKHIEAEQVRQQFEQVWSEADVTLTNSIF